MAKVDVFQVPAKTFGAQHWTLTSDWMEDTPGSSEGGNTRSVWQRAEGEGPGLARLGGGGGASGPGALYTSWATQGPASLEDFLNTKCNLLKNVLQNTKY